MSDPSAHSTRQQFSLRQLMSSRMKPAWCSDIRWQIELRRRAATGIGRGRRTDLDAQAEEQVS